MKGNKDQYREVILG